MKYNLMHKDVCVAELELDNITGSIHKVGAVYNASHLPVGILQKNNIVDRAGLNAWWIDRSIPASRSGIRRALDVLNLPNTKMLLTKCFGLSLSDQYWIQPSNTDIKWKDINFFDNPFSEDIGDVLLGKETKEDGFDFHSPDNTSDGCLKKRWKIIDGKRCLIKAGSNPFMQQPFNEVIASKIMDVLGVEHVPYTLVWDEDKPYSVCEDFITANTELVSAWRVMQTQKKNNAISVYQHYINCCKALGVVNIEHYVDQMIVLDYIIANEDRHQNNFGLIRDANTLKWIGVAPIFDSGSSLGYDKLPAQILNNKDIECKPFKKSHDEQIKLVQSFDWLDFDKLKTIEDIIFEVFGKAEPYMDEARIHAIVESVNKRIDDLQALAMSYRMAEDNVEQDVREDIAQSYEMKMDF